jgi:hypothetical protein
MWIVTKLGFYNIIQYEEDKKADFLTVKARAKEDLENLDQYVPQLNGIKIEESDNADYRFRTKLHRKDVTYILCSLVDEIDYKLTKPAITEKFPERATTYLNVWDDLYAIQETHRS